MRDSTDDTHTAALDAAFLIRLAALLTAVLLLTFCPGVTSATESEKSPAAYIVKGKSARRAGELVVEVGGKVTHELKIIRAVGARLTGAQRDTLAAHPEIVRVWRDRQAKVQSAGRGERPAGLQRLPAG